MDDYNSKIETIKQSITEDTKDTFVTTVELAYKGHDNRIADYNVPVGMIKPITSYSSNGGATPLWDAVGLLITTFEGMPDFHDPTSAFLVFVVTDGEENASRVWSASMLSSKIQKLVASDKFTFAFRVPRGHKTKFLHKINLDAYNVEEWDLTDEGAYTATVNDNTGLTNYFTARSSGATYLGRFYASVAPQVFDQVKTSMDRVYPTQVATVGQAAGIRDFVEQKLGRSYIIGTAFYQLTKTETVQPNKKIVIKKLSTGEYFGGPSVRQFFGLPQNGSCGLSPAHNPEFEIYVQSTSTNRKLRSGTTLLLM